MLEESTTCIEKQYPGHCLAQALYLLFGTLEVQCTASAVDVPHTGYLVSLQAPLMLELGVTPAVASATSATMIL